MDTRKDVSVKLPDDSSKSLRWLKRFGNHGNRNTDTDSVQSTKEGGEYSVTSFGSLRAALRDVNIISDTVFKTSNAVFKAMPKRYRKSGKDITFYHSHIP